MLININQNKGILLCICYMIEWNNQWYDAQGKPRPPIPQQAGNLQEEINRVGSE